MVLHGFTVSDIFSTLERLRGNTRNQPARSSIVRLVLRELRGRAVAGVTQCCSEETQEKDEQVLQQL